VRVNYHGKDWRRGWGRRWGAVGVCYIVLALVRGVVRWCPSARCVGRNAFGPGYFNARLKGIRS